MILRSFCFNDTATTEIYTLSLHDALPISVVSAALLCVAGCESMPWSKKNKDMATKNMATAQIRSEEHTSELQSRQYLVCRLLLEKKKNAFAVTDTPA